jgi:hypothetical protein
VTGVIFYEWIWQRILTDFWPVDSGRVSPNITAAIVQGVILLAILRLVWPKFRTRLDAWVRAHLHAHHLLHVAPHHDAMAELLHEIRALLVHQMAHGGSSPPASSATSFPAKGAAPMGSMSDIAADIEHRLGYHPNLTSDIGAAHEKVRLLLADAAKEAVTVATTVAPWSRELSLAMTAIEEADHWLHAHIARNQAGVAPVVPNAPVAPVAHVVPVVPTPDVPAAPADVPAPTGAPGSSPVATTVVPDPVVPAAPVPDPAPAASSSTPPIPDPAPAEVEVTLPEAEVAPVADIPPASPSAP